MAKLKRALGLTSLTFYGVGVIVGAGIYSVIGAAAGEAGYSLWISFAIAAVVAGLTALSYAELVTAISSAGAEYVYLGRAFPKHAWISYITGFIVALTGAATVATVTTAFAGYFQNFVSFPSALTAGILMLLLTGINIAGIQESSRVNMVLTSIEVLGLILIIGAGLFEGKFANNALTSPDMTTLAGAALVFFVYTGFQSLANLSEEAIEPKRDLPRAIILSLIITTILYMLVALAATGLMPPDEMSQSQSPLASVAKSASPTLATVISWIALFSTANTALITLIVTSRLLFSMARNSDMPPFLAKVNRRKSPWLAAFLMFAGSAVFLPLGNLAEIASMSAFTALITFTGVNIALIVLRYREPRLARAFKVPLSIGRMPIIPLLAIVLTLLLMTQFELKTYAIGGSALMGGVVLFLIHRKVTGKRHKQTRQTVK